MKSNNIILSIRKTCFVRKGGRNFNFSVLSLYSKKNYIGFGKGKSKHLNKSIDKSNHNSIKNKKKILMYGKKLNRYMKIKYCSSLVEFFPVENKFISGGVSRTILKSARIKNVACKNIGSRNVSNLIEVFKTFFNLTNGTYLDE
ncbi:hypothetical protein ACWNYO_00810 [Candidatus Vidania fulgoroideorum]